MKRMALQESLYMGNANYRVHEYQLILNPHEELRKKIIAVKKDFSEAFEAASAKWGKPQLTLVRFKQLEMMEERIVNHLKRVAMGYHPFKVELVNYGSYPAHSIFINVTTKEPIKNLVREIKPWQKLLKLDEENKPHFIDDPAFLVARQLKPWQYENAWKEYQYKHFTGRFIADSMLLLKRRAGETAYQVIQRFEFQNLPVSTKQGELFA